MNEDKVKKAVVGNVCIFIATIFWGVNYAFTKALIPEFMSSGNVSACRLLGGALLFWLASLFVKCEKLDRDSMIRAFLSGVIGLFGCIYLFVLALDYGSAIDISIIMTLQPVYVVLIEVIFLKRRPSLMEYAGMGLSLIGACVIILCGHRAAGASNFLLGDFLAILAGICFAGYLVVLAKPTAKYKPVSLLRWVFLYSAMPAAFLVAGLFEMPLLHTEAAAPWLEIAFIVLGPTFLAYLLQQPAIHDIGAVLDALYQYLVPVVAAISAVWMGVDKLRWEQVAAMAIIIAGMILTNIGKWRK